MIWYNIDRTKIVNVCDILNISSKFDFYMKKHKFVGILIEV